MRRYLIRCSIVIFIVVILSGSPDTSFSAVELVILRPDPAQVSAIYDRATDTLTMVDIGTGEYDVVIYNDGDEVADISDMEIQAEFPPCWLSLVEPSGGLPFPLDPGASFGFDLTWDPDCTSDDGVEYASLAVGSRDMYDNTPFIWLTVVLTTTGGTPDLKPVQTSFDPYSTSFVAGKTVQWTERIVNLGPGATDQNSSMTFSLGSSCDDPVQIIGTDIVPALNPDSSFYANGDFTPTNALIGDVFFIAEVDVNDDIVEVDETNNVYCSPGTIQPCYHVTPQTLPGAGGAINITPDTSCNLDTPGWVGDTELTLSVDVAAGYAFTGWAGDLTGSANPVQYTLTEDSNITAEFEPAATCYDLTISIDPADTGSVTVEPIPNCNVDQYSPGTVITLTAEAMQHYAFDGWSGDVTSSINKVTVTMEVDKDITAEFSLICHAVDVSVNPEFSGTATVSPAPNCGDSEYVDGTSVTLSASAAEYYEFDSWTGDVSSTSDPVGVTVNDDLSVVANFSRPCYDFLSMEESVGGTWTVEPQPNCSYGFLAGTALTLTAIPEDGHYFVEWYGDILSTDNPLVVTADAHRIIECRFDSLTPCYTLTRSVIPDGVGNISYTPRPNCTTDSYDPGTVITLTAYTYSTYSDDYMFYNWSGDLTGSTNPETITMDADRSITAHFGEMCYDVTLLSDPPTGGSIVAGYGPNCNITGYTENAYITVTAEAATGYVFNGWLGNVEVAGDTNPNWIRVRDDVTVTAEFDAVCYDLTLLTDPLKGGSITPSIAPNCPDHNDKYLEGTSISLTAEPAEGYVFDSWSGDLSGSTNPNSITIDGDKSVMASFEESSLCYHLTVGIDPAGTGTVTTDVPLNCDEVNFTAGTVVTLTALAEPGHSFVTWNGDVVSTTNPLAMTINAETFLTAIFGTAHYPVYIPIVLK